MNTHTHTHIHARAHTRTHTHTHTHAHRCGHRRDGGAEASAGGARRAENAACGRSPWPTRIAPSRRRRFRIRRGRRAARRAGRPLAIRTGEQTRCFGRLLPPAVEVHGRLGSLQVGGADFSGRLLQCADAPRHGFGRRRLLRTKILLCAQNKSAVFSSVRSRRVVFDEAAALIRFPPAHCRTLQVLIAHTNQFFFLACRLHITTHDSGT